MDKDKALFFNMLQQNGLMHNAFLLGRWSLISSKQINTPGRNRIRPSPPDRFKQPALVPAPA